MIVLFNGEQKEYEVSHSKGDLQIIKGIEYRRRFLGQRIGDFEIVSVDYDFGLRKRRDIVRCVRCGFEKEIPNLSAFARGKGAGLFCKCRYLKQYVPKNEEYRKRIGETVCEFKAIDYSEGKGFRVECLICGKQKWASGKEFLEGKIFCNHREVRNYSDPKYIGMKIGNLTVVERIGKLFKFRCDCGSEIVRRPSEVFRIEVIKTCGRSECPYHRALVSAGHDKRLGGIEFERECAEDMKRRGFVVELLPETGDYGVDFVVTIGGDRVAFQCKKLKTASMISAVQQVYTGGIFYGCNKYVVISPSGFTSRAEILASKIGVQLERDVRNFNVKEVS